MSILELPRRGKIASWNPDRGFGFVDVGGQRIFIHCSAVSPQPARGSTLAGELLILQVGRSDKGLRVERAEQVTAETASRLARLAEAKLAIREPVAGSVELSNGWHARASKTEVWVCEMRANGPWLQIEQDIEFCDERGRLVGASHNSSYREGWEHVSVPIGGTKAVREHQTLRVCLVPKLVINQSRSADDWGYPVEFPVSRTDEPQRDGRQVYQKLYAQTPLGEVQCQFYPASLAEVWGSYDASVLFTEAQEAALAHVGISGQMPAVSFEVKNDRTVITVYDRFLTKACQGDRDDFPGEIHLRREPEVRESSYLQVRLFGLDRDYIEDLIGQVAQVAAEKSRLGQVSTEYVGQLVTHVVGQLPLRKEEVWIVASGYDFDDLPEEIRRDVPFGFAQAGWTEEEGKHRPVAPTKALKPEVAMALAIPGYRLETWVYWPEGAEEFGVSNRFDYFRRQRAEEADWFAKEVAIFDQLSHCPVCGRDIRPDVRWMYGVREQSGGTVCNCLDRYPADRDEMLVELEMGRPGLLTGECCDMYRDRPVLKSVSTDTGTGRFFIIEGNCRPYRWHVALAIDVDRPRSRW